MNLLHYILGALAISYVVLMMLIPFLIYKRTRNVDAAFSIGDEQYAKEHGALTGSQLLMLRAASTIKKGIIAVGVIIILTELVSISIRR